MMTMTRRAAMFSAVGALLAGCEMSHSTSTGDTNPNDIDFVTNAFNIIQFDREECTLAETRAKNPDVRSLAAQLLQQANDFDARLRPIAASAGISPPTVLRTDLRIRVVNLRLNQGVDFDRPFVEDQIVSHQDALNLQQSMMDTQGGNPQLQALARDGTSILRTNLAKLQNLQRKMMMMRQGRSA